MEEGYYFLGISVVINKNACHYFKIDAGYIF